MKDKQFPILLIEDDPADVAILRQVFQELSIENPLQVAGSGQEAWSFLQEQLDSASAEIPKIILLDLSLPDKEGLALLKQLRQEPALRSSIVYVITSSSSEQDIAQAYAFHVAGYFVKPSQYEAFREMVHTLHSFWSLIELPN